MLNQALTELQSALTLLEETTHNEANEAEWSDCLTQITVNVHQSIKILQKLEHTLNADKLTLVTNVESEKKSEGYVQHPWQKTA